MSQLQSALPKRHHPPSWDRIWHLVRPLLVFAMLMHIGFFTALALMAPVHGADVAVLCTAMIAVLVVSVYCIGRHWRDRPNNMPSARRWMVAGYFCIPVYQVLAILVGGRMGLLTTHRVRLLGDTVLIGALFGAALFFIPQRLLRKR